MVSKVLSHAHSEQRSAGGFRRGRWEDVAIGILGFNDGSSVSTDGLSFTGWLGQKINLLEDCQNLLVSQEGLTVVTQNHSGLVHKTSSHTSQFTVMQGSRLLASCGPALF